MENQIDPGVVVCADDQVARNGCLVEQQRLRFFEFEAVACVAEFPAEGGAYLADVEEESLRDVGRWHDHWEWGDKGLIQEDCVCCCVLIVDRYPWVGWSVELWRALVPHYRGGIEDLLHTCADHAHGIVSSWLIEWHKYRVAI